MLVARPTYYSPRGREAELCQEKLSAAEVSPFGSSGHLQSHSGSGMPVTILQEWYSDPWTDVYV
jgi:hypothetical protein